MLDAAGELDIEAVDQRDIHFRADDRHEKFGEGRIDFARAAGVGRGAGARNVAAIDFAGHAVGEGDRPVEPRIAVIVEGFAAPFDACGDTQIAARQRQEVVAADLEVAEREAGTALAVDVDTEGIDRRGRVGCAVADAGIGGNAAAVERIIGVRRRQVDLILHQRERHTVARQVVELRFRINEAGVEVPRADIAAQAADEAIDILVYRHVAITDIDEAIALHDDIHTARGDGGAGQAVGTADRAERVPIGIFRNADRHRAQDGRSIELAVVFRPVEAAFEIGLDIVAEFVAQQRHRIVATLLADQAVAIDRVVADGGRRRRAVAGAETVAEAQLATGKA